MKRLLPAYLLLALVAAACDSPSGSSRIDRVVVTPAARNLNAGDTFQLSAVARDEGSEVISNVTFQWSSLEPAVASVDGSGVVTGLSTGTARVVVSAGSKADTAVITVFGTAAECDEPGAGISLSVGQSVQRNGAGASVLCLEGGAQGAEYTVVAFHGTRSSTAVLPLRADAAGVSAPLGPPNPSLAPSSSLLLSGGAGADAVEHADGGFHARLNAAAYDRLRPRAASARAEYRRRRGGEARFDLQQAAPPAVGTLLPLNASLEACDSPAARTGRVVAVGERAIVVADTGNPAGGMTAADYQNVATTFDTLVYPVNAAAFGEPQDVDLNGRVIIFYTRVVNELTPPNADYVVGGFFYARDLFPRNDCPTSNVAEMFYMLAADPAGVVNGNVRSVEEVLNSTIGTVGHELQHLINASRRLYVVQTDEFDEEVWLNEGLSHIAEELLFYRRAMIGPRGNRGSGILATGSLTRQAFILFGQQNYARYGEYLRNPETESPYKNSDELGTRGAAWAFLRYAADRRNGDDQQLWFSLVNNQVVGMDNLQEVLAQDPIDLFRDFTVSVYTDDAVTDVPAVFTQPSWNWRTLFPAIRGSFPLLVRPLSSGGPSQLTLAAGGTAYFRAAVQSGKRGSVRLSTGGGPLTQNAWVTVVRTK